ncbi:sugar transporter, putative [Plasmodium reichenowi]|uniref:Sugar transporter, putative n=1 Tax=Plasmodium reichenowi TaxID=5854 RepID=A0A2P9DCV9_PLARE|nr:sugar transporter, putative [Plasmodium reichenowi]
MAEIKNLTKKKENIYNKSDKINNKKESNNIYINKNINIYNNKNIHVYNNEHNNYKVSKEIFQNVKYIHSADGTPGEVYPKNYISIINSEHKNKMKNEKNESNMSNIKNEKNKKAGSEEIQTGIEYMNNINDDNICDDNICDDNICDDNICDDNINDGNIYDDNINDGNIYDGNIYDNNIYDNNIYDNNIYDNNIHTHKSSNNSNKSSHSYYHSNENMKNKNTQIDVNNCTTNNSYEYNNTNNIIKECKKDKCYLLYNENKDSSYYYMNGQNNINNYNYNNIIIKGGNIHNNIYYNTKPVDKYEHYSKCLQPVIINNNNNHNNNNNNIDCNCINIKSKLNYKNQLKINNISVYDQKKKKTNNNIICSSDFVKSNNIYTPIQVNEKKYIVSKKYMSPNIKNNNIHLKEKNKSYIINNNNNNKEKKKHMEYSTNCVIKKANNIKYNDINSDFNNIYNNYNHINSNCNNINENTTLCNNKKYIEHFYKSANNAKIELKEETCHNDKNIQNRDKLFCYYDNNKVYENIQNNLKNKKKNINIYKENMLNKKREGNNNSLENFNNNNNMYKKEEENFTNVKNNIHEKAYTYEQNNFDKNYILPKKNESTNFSYNHDNINNIKKKKILEKSSYMNKNNLNIIQPFDQKINEVLPSDLINSYHDIKSDYYESIPSHNVSLSKIPQINIPQNNTICHHIEPNESGKYDSYNDETNNMYSVEVMDNSYHFKYKNNLYNNKKKEEDIKNKNIKMSDFYMDHVNDKKDQNKCNSFQKRASISYSGLLTSMVSSILTQQNERKIKESNNCLNYSWGINKYDYTLLQTIEDNTEMNDSNVILRKKLIQGFNNKKSSEHILTLTLSLMICISILCNYDHGAIPVTLEEIQKDFPLSYIEQSLLGSLVYFGLIIGTIMASILFELLSAKLLVTISIILLSISLYIFSHANCITFMYISRFVNGLCQAIPVVYLPVWVDEFSPDEKATQWMSYIQLASIGGTVFGYFLGGILSNNSYSYHKNDSIFSNINVITTWRSPFLIQAFLLLPIFLIMIFIPSDKINITSNNSDCSDNISTEEIDDITQRQNKKHKDNNNFKNKYSNHKYINNIYNSNTYDNIIYKHNNSFNNYNNVYYNNNNNNNVNICQNNQTKDISYSSKDTNKSIAQKHKYKKTKLFSDSKNKLLRRNFNRSATYIMEKKTNVLKKTLKEVKKLFHNKLYIIITLGMSNLYFVVTGIQFWITEYMSVVLLTEKMKIVTVSTLCFLTSPTSGVWFGGFVCDLFGGYKNTNYSKTIKVATAFAISACIFGILSAHLKNFIFFSISLWLCLFTGSALVPVCVGMLLSCVNNHQKSLSSAVSQVIYNVFGWFSAPLLSGIIMDIMHKYTNDNRLALKAGFTMILYSSSIGFLLLLYANFLDLSEKKDNDDLIELEEPLT